MIILAPERNFVRNGSFTVKDFRLYDETSSSKGRSPVVEGQDKLPTGLHC